MSPFLPKYAGLVTQGRISVLRLDPGFFYVAYSSKTGFVQSMTVGNRIVAEKRQPEQKLSFCSDLGKKNPTFKGSGPSVVGGGNKNPNLGLLKIDFFEN